MGGDMRAVLPKRRPGHLDAPPLQPWVCASDHRTPRDSVRSPSASRSLLRVSQSGIGGSDGYWQCPFCVRGAADRSTHFRHLPPPPPPPLQASAAGCPGLPCSMQQAAHTTSDLLRLLAAEGAAFADVAAAVAARFGGDPASRAWLARTLTTLLRVRHFRGG